MQIAVDSEVPESSKNAYISLSCTYLEKKLVKMTKERWIAQEIRRFNKKQNFILCTSRIAEKQDVC